MGRGAGRVFHQFVQSDFHGQFVERFALYNFRAGVGKETLAASFKVAVYNVSYNSVQDGISQKFKPFVINGASFFGTQGDGFMQQSLLVNLDVTWEEAENSVETKIRLSILAEQEPYFVYLVT